MSSGSRSGLTAAWSSTGSPGVNTRSVNISTESPASTTRLCTTRRARNRYIAPFLDDLPSVRPSLRVPGRGADPARQIILQVLSGDVQLKPEEQRQRRQVLGPELLDLLQEDCALTLIELAFGPFEQPVHLRVLVAGRVLADVVVGRRGDLAAVPDRPEVGGRPAHPRVHHQMRISPLPCDLAEQHRGRAVVDDEVDPDRLHLVLDDLLHLLTHRVARGRHYRDAERPALPVAEDAVRSGP